MIPIRKKLKNIRKIVVLILASLCLSGGIETSGQERQPSFQERFWREAKERFAASSDLYRERLEFDAEGNLWMTTRDKNATSSVRYRTIGFTIKREAKPIRQTMSVRVRLETTKESLPDPTDSRYSYKYFCIRKEDIYQKILLCSEEWANDLFLNGGMLYLDSVMTVVENQKAKGSMNYSGTLTGEVYDTFEGIAGARNWSDPDALRTHFDKEVYFPGNPEMLDRVPVVEEYSELVERNSAVQEENLPGLNVLSLTSGTYDVEEAIPSGEQVNVAGNLQKVFYQALFEHLWGKYTFPVAARVHYKLIWEEDGHHEEDVTILDFYDIERTYSYWKIREITPYYLEYATIENAALCNTKRINSTYKPEIALIFNQENYMVLPETAVEVDGGTLWGGDRCPAIPYGGVKEKVEETVAQISVNNDGFTLDGVDYLKSGWSQKETAAPTALSGEQLLPVFEAAGQIRTDAANETYPNTVTAYYKKVGTEECVSSPVSRTNSLSVHTPVVCRAAVSDEKAWNQQVNPTENISLILGRGFSVEISAAGEHIASRGYGARDYDTYVRDYQVNFPFAVRYGTQEIAAGSWISLREKKTGFTLPEWVEEGDFTVSFRTIAINCGADETAQESANLDKKYYAAEHKIPVTVVGRLYGFKITDVIDYPRWQSVFWNIVQQRRSGTCYYAGLSDCNGKRQRTADSIYLCPLLKGSHPYNPNAGAVGLGYRVDFSFETIGRRDGEMMGMTLKPAYYYMERDGSGRQRVRLYDKDTLEEISLPFELDSSAIDSTKTLWSGSCRIPADVYIVPETVNLRAYIKDCGGRIRLRDSIFLRGGYLIVNVDLTSRYGKAAHLNYKNSANERRGYCNMWAVEEYQTERKDGDGTTYTFAQGDVFVFDCQNTILNDYDSYGTH